MRLISLRYKLNISICGAPVPTNAIAPVVRKLLKAGLKTDCASRSRPCGARRTSRTRAPRTGLEPLATVFKQALKGFYSRSKRHDARRAAQSECGVSKDRIERFRSSAAQPIDPARKMVHFPGRINKRLLVCVTAQTRPHAAAMLGKRKLRARSRAVAAEANSVSSLLKRTSQWAPRLHKQPLSFKVKHGSS